MDRHEANLRLYDAFSAKAPYIVARMFGDADFSDFLSLSQPEKAKQDKFDDFVANLASAGLLTHGEL